MAYFLGIDIGTSGTKTILCDERGTILASVTEEYPCYQPKPNWSEQDPADWWSAATATIRAAIEQAGIKGSEVKGIGLSGQMHGAVLLDKNHEVLRPAILWNDQRTAEECRQITSTIGAGRLIELTCNPALTGFTAPKILWVRNNEPQIYERTVKVLLPKDYIRFRLTGEFATEVSDASGTLLLDVKNRRWSDEVLADLKIDRSLLPECFESPEISATVRADVAAELGIPAGTPVAGGAGDQAASAVGNGIVKSGVISATLGTSGVVFAFSDTVQTDVQGRVHTFCHAVPGKWHVMGVMLSAGGSLQWFRNNLGEPEKTIAVQEGVDPYDVLCREASRLRRALFPALPDGRTHAARQPQRQGRLDRSDGAPPQGAHDPRDARGDNIRHEGFAGNHQRDGRANQRDTSFGRRSSQRVLAAASGRHLRQRRRHHQVYRRRRVGRSVIGGSRHRHVRVGRRSLRCGH